MKNIQLETDIKLKVHTENFSDRNYVITQKLIDEYNASKWNLGMAVLDSSVILELNLSNVSHNVKKMYLKDNELFVEIQLLETPSGLALKHVPLENIKAYPVVMAKNEIERIIRIDLRCDALPANKENIL